MGRLVAAVSVALAAAVGGCGDGDGGGDPAPGELALYRAKTAMNPVRDVVTTSGDGGEQRVAIGGSAESDVVPTLFTQPSWSPDGNRIAFAGQSRGDAEREGTEDETDRSDVYVVGADGEGLRRLTSTHDAGAPVWSPDGRAIVFSRRRGDAFAGSASLWWAPAGGGTARQITGWRKRTTDRPGSFWRSGDALAFTRGTCADRYCAERRTAVFTIALDGSGERRLLDDASDPDVSPDGRRLAFVSDRDANGSLSYGDQESPATELYTADAEGGSVRRLTRTRDVNEWAPDWSPGGHRIALQRGRVTGNAEGMSVLQMNADGSCERPVLADPKLDVWYSGPEWRPGDRARPSGALEC